MAVITDIKGKYYYIHNNKENLSGSFKNIELIEKEKTILQLCIDKQKEREQKVLNLAGVKNTEELYEKLYGKKSKENNQNRLDESLSLLEEFFMDVFSYESDGNKISILSDKNNKNKINENFCSKVVNSFLNYKTEFKNWLKNNKQLDENNININNINMILDKTTPFLNKKVQDKIHFNTIEENGVRKIEGSINLETTKKILEDAMKEYKSSAYNFFGDLSEAGSVCCVDSGLDYILRMSTSDWFVKGSKLEHDLLPEQLNFNKIKEKYSKEINNLKTQIENSGVATENFSIKPSSFLKADEIFGIKIEIDGKTDFFTFGISNKMAATLDSLSVKAQDTSLNAILSNMYMVKGQDTEYISKAIQFILVNASGILSWDRKKPRDKANVNIELGDGNTTIERILRQLVAAFSYIWFTGGDVMGAGHADYFLVTKNFKTYFLPFSSVLEKIKKNMDAKDSYFSAIGYNRTLMNPEYLITLGHMKKDNNPELENTMKNYFKNTWKSINKETLILINDFNNLLI